jgi:hypothetical protein
MSLEMAHKVILPPKKNYIPQFLKQRDINSYYCSPSYLFYGITTLRIIQCFALCIKYRKPDIIVFFPQFTYLFIIPD